MGNNVSRRQPPSGAPERLPQAVDLQSSRASERVIEALAPLLSEAIAVQPTNQDIGSEPPADPTIIVNERRYERQGDHPTIVAIDNILIEVHDHDNKLWYDLFEVSDKGYFSTIRAATEYESGKKPNIAAATKSKMIIDLHCSTNSWDLLYDVGQLDLKGGKINWRTLRGEFGEGDFPHITVTKSDIVVAVYNGAGNDQLFVRIGELNVETALVRWKPSAAFYSKGHRAALQINDADLVVEVHEGGGGSLYYSVGKLNSESLALDWLSTGSRFDHGYNPAVMVDNFGVVMEVHDEGNNVHYRLGILEENYVAWHGERGTRYDPGKWPTLVSMPVGRNVIVECHHNSGNLFQTSMAFGTEITSFTYGDAIESDAVRFATLVTEFNNAGPSTITQDWSVTETYSCSDTYNWETQLYAGVSATVEVGFFGGGASVTAETSITMTVGESSTISKESVMDITLKVELPPQSGKVKYTAELFRVPIRVPFSASFKRGDTKWTENGNVAVSHGMLFARIKSEA